MNVITEIILAVYCSANIAYTMYAWGRDERNELRQIQQHRHNLEIQSHHQSVLDALHLHRKQLDELLNKVNDHTDRIGILQSVQDYKIEVKYDEPKKKWRAKTRKAK